MSVELTPAQLERELELEESWPFLNAEPSAGYRPGQSKVRFRKSVSHTIRNGVASMLRSAARRDDFDVPNLTELAALEVELEEALVTAVANLRRQGHSWAVIGRALGCTRQAAFIRFDARVRLDPEGN
jgi:hypothetical protein